MNTIESASLSWTRSVLSHEQVIQWTKAKVRVDSDSVLCLEKMNDSKDAITRWEGQVEEFKMSPSTKNCWESMGNQLNSSGTFSQDFHHCRFFKKFQDDLGERNIEPETRSSSCQCSMTSVGQEKETMEFIFRKQKSQGIREEISRKNSGRSSTLETKRSGMKLFFAHLKENVTLQPLKWWNE